MARKITTQQLATPATQGKKAVAELLVDHIQKGCVTVAAGTRFVVKAVVDGEAVALFPHDAIDQKRVFSDGHIRIVPQNSYKVVGRIS